MTGDLVLPSSKCCCCLSLKTGTIVIGVSNCVLYGCLYIWYLTSDLLHQGGFGDGMGFNSSDISILSILTVQVTFHCILIDFYFYNIVAAPCQYSAFEWSPTRDTFPHASMARS